MIRMLRVVLEDYRFYQSISSENAVAVALSRPLWVCISYRYGHWAHYVNTPLLGRIARALYIMLNSVVSAASSTHITCTAEIGHRLMVHTLPGFVIGAKTRIGDDCVINAGVCLVGRANGRAEGSPWIGDRVYLGVGAKVLGSVSVGDDAVIGANAVVLQNVPAGHMAIGIPAVARPLSHMSATVASLENEACTQHAESISLPGAEGKL